MVEAEGGAPCGGKARGVVRGSSCSLAAEVGSSAASRNPFRLPFALQIGAPVTGLRIVVSAYYRAGGRGTLRTHENKKLQTGMPRKLVP